MVTRMIEAIKKRLGKRAKLIQSWEKYIEMIYAESEKPDMTESEKLTLEVKKSLLSIELSLFNIYSILVFFRIMFLVIVSAIPICILLGIL